MKFNTKTVGYAIGAVICIPSTIAGLHHLIKQSTTYDDNGFDTDGYDRNGFNKEGFNCYGFDKQGFDINGFDSDGYDRTGFDSSGFNIQGFDITGYDKDGRDQYGYDRSGFDIDGFDRSGYDSEGYRRNGFDRNGYNRDGFDWQGYKKNKYNAAGIDRIGHNQQFYSEHIELLRERLDDSYDRLQNGEYRYSLFDARTVMEEVLRIIVGHSLGPDRYDDKLLTYLKICEHKNLLDADSAFMNRLHDVRKICNTNGHEFDAEASMTHDRVHFVIMQVRDLLDSAEDTLINS